MGVFNRGLSDQGSPKTTFQFFDGLVQIPMNDIRDPIQDVVLKSGGEWVPVTAKRHITTPKTGNLNILGIIVISGEGLKIELSRKKFERAQGNQVSTFQFKRTAPRRVPAHHDCSLRTREGENNRPSARNPIKMGVERLGTPILGNTRRSG